MVEQPTFVLYRLNDEVTLAGQPQPEEVEWLRRQGYRSVLNIRTDPILGAVEGRNVERAGLAYRFLPLPAYELELEHVRRFGQAVRELPKPLFFHCRTASRTGLLWMLHRMLNEGWSREAAEAELRAAGYGDGDMEVFNFCVDDFFERQPAAAERDRRE